MTKSKKRNNKIIKNNENNQPFPPADPNVNENVVNDNEANDLIAAASYGSSTLDEKLNIETIVTFLTLVLIFSGVRIIKSSNINNNC